MCVYCIYIFVDSKFLFKSICVMTKCKCFCFQVNQKKKTNSSAVRNTLISDDESVVDLFIDPSMTPQNGFLRTSEIQREPGCGN